MNNALSKSLWLSVVIGWLILALPLTGYSQNVMQATQLQCEHLVNPIGIDTPHPRLSWKMQDTRQGVAQTAYRIIIDKDSLTVVNDSGQI